MRGTQQTRRARRSLVTLAVGFLTASAPFVPMVYAAGRARVMNAKVLILRENRPGAPRQDELSARLQHEYGAIFLARNGIVIPPKDMFSSEEEVGAWQAAVPKAGGDYLLQVPANDALAAARADFSD